MKKTTGIEGQVSGVISTSAEVRGNRTCKVSKDVLRLVEASKLSLNDKFMQYKPVGGTNECIFKEMLTEAIKSGLNDFWRPKMDPSFDETGHICYVAGKRPAVGKSKEWWQKEAEWLGLDIETKKQGVAFLGYIIKKLVEEGVWTVPKAWYAVCIYSSPIGHYKDSLDAKLDFEKTGSREVCGFCDLGNTYKMYEEDKEEITGGYWLSGGYHRWRGNEWPLSLFSHVKSSRVASSRYVASLVYNHSTVHQ